ncbi:hypothetical protein JB92DRAFT_2912505 [Gautieria morchelliformis]|nr:hypothetical protein JB92DRAFT_2912505 [Gautieria morchelliformis]
MSESFSDIWASSNPVRSQKPQPRTLGVAAKNVSNVALRPTPDAFSMLASAGSGPNSRSITPSLKQPSATSNNGTTSDAFGGLVSFGNSTSRDGGLTIAERAAKAERERKEQTGQEEVTFNVQGSFWDKYESLSVDEPPVPDTKIKSNSLLDLDFLNEEMGEVAQTAVEERSSRQRQEQIGGQVEEVTQAVVEERSSRQREEEIGWKAEEVTLAVVEERKSRGSRGHRESARATSPSGPSSPLSLQQQGLQDQADKLLNQASTIGMTMFSKANAFWKESREKVVKAYEEQRSGTLGAEDSKRRPRWMEDNWIGDNADEGPAEEYHDPSQKHRISTQPSHSTREPVHFDASVSLFASDEPVYRSPARRRPAAAASTSKAPSTISTPTELSLPVRPNIVASPSILAASGTSKVAGNEHFRLGRFAEAEAAYSQAIDALPASHLSRIPLCNNRALTRLKTGDYKGTIDDTSQVLRIIAGDIGTAWHPGREEAGARKRFADAMGKALRRRAEAYEGLEKWKEAAGDWEWLRAAAWVGVTLKGDAAKGLGRCRQMALDGSDPAIGPQRTSKLKNNPQSKPSPVRVSPARPSEALTRVRAANTAQEKEDQSRHDLKDVIDARVNAWRTGKENNLRALIASLEVVLSSTFGWQTVGMSELVSPRQVKVQYTKAIAKLHPDKLNVNDYTLEERMIANSVFGTLNESWNMFR